MEKKLITNIIQQFVTIQNGSTWYGDSIEEKIRSVDEKKAFVRPLVDIHSVAELISHVIVWRQVGIERLKGLQVTIPEDSPENWKSNEDLQKIGWDALKADLRDSHEQLIKVLDEKDDRFLEKTWYKKAYPMKFLAEGILHHDLYHLGQIGITIKLLASEK